MTERGFHPFAVLHFLRKTILLYLLPLLQVLFARNWAALRTALVQGKAFIDLYYETYEESVENAVIPVTVYVLDDETAARYKEQNDAILEADTVVGR
jgi:hypothetical protein